MTNLERLSLWFCTLVCLVAVLGGYVVTVDVILPAAERAEAVFGRLEKVEKLLARMPFRVEGDNDEGPNE